MFVSLGNYNATVRLIMCISLWLRRNRATKSDVLLHVCLRKVLPKLSTRFFYNLICLRSVVYWTKWDMMLFLEKTFIRANLSNGPIHRSSSFSSPEVRYHSTSHPIPPESKPSELWIPQPPSETHSFPKNRHVNCVGFLLLVFKLKKNSHNHLSILHQSAHNYASTRTSRFSSWAKHLEPRYEESV